MDGYLENSNISVTRKCEADSVTEVTEPEKLAQSHEYELVTCGLLEGGGYNAMLMVTCFFHQDSEILQLFGLNLHIEKIADGLQCLYTQYFGIWYSRMGLFRILLELAAVEKSHADGVKNVNVTIYQGAKPPIGDMTRFHVTATRVM